jgi:hypothetical protein
MEAAGVPVVDAVDSGLVDPEPDALGVSVARVSVGCEVSTRLAGR